MFGIQALECSFTLIGEGVSVQLKADDVGSLLPDPLDIQIHIPKEKKLNIKLPEDADIPQVKKKLPESDETPVKEAGPAEPEVKDSNPEAASKKPNTPEEAAMIVKSKISPNANTATPGLLSWRKYLGKNCWEGHGADNMSPEPYSKSLSLTNCQGACEEDESCEGIVIKRGKESLGPCFMRRNIQLSRCKDKTPYDLYLKQTGSTATTEEDPKASVTPKSRISFNHHARAQ